MTFLEDKGPTVARDIGERLHLVKPRRRLQGLGIAAGLLGVAAVAGLLLSARQQS